MPLFAIVIPAYNAASTIGETIDSVRSQSFSDWECVVVDDGSCDSTGEIVRSFAQQDARFKLLTQPNRGTGAAYNAGIALAQADWIVMCSADDTLDPNLISTYETVISGGRARDLMSVNGRYAWADGSRELVYSDSDAPRSNEWTLSRLFMGSFFSVGASFSRSMWLDLGGFREGVWGEDYDLWLRALAAGYRHLYIDEPLAVHTRSDTQKTSAITRVLESDIESISTVVRSGCSLTMRERICARLGRNLRASLMGLAREPRSFQLRLRRKIYTVVGRAICK